MWQIRAHVFTGLAVAVALAQSAQAVSLWDESVLGDLSNDRLAPTALVLGLGSNTISGTTVSGDRDYFSLVVPDGTSFQSITLTAYSAPFDQAFLGIQTGTTITEDPNSPNVAHLLGWVHLNSSLVGTDILDNMGVGSGAIGFLPPLGPGTYSFWLQQLGGTLTGYGLDFVVVPEPTVAAFLTLGLAGLAVVGRRR